MSGEKRLRSCVCCGVEFMGGPDARYCPDCRTAKVTEGVRKKLQTSNTKRTGWRNMFRDRTGTVIVPGGNVITALDDLCAYEETCEAAGIHGPEELRKVLEGLKAKDRGDPSTVLSRSASHASREDFWGQHCEDCGHFHPEELCSRRGICDRHPRRIRINGGKSGPYAVLAEPRPVVARRVACKDWFKAEGNRPQWVGPSAELVPEEV